MPEEKQKIKTEEKRETGEKLKIVKINDDDKTNKQAIVNGRNLSLSLKYAVAICNYIKNKEIDKAISMLGEVIKMKKPVPMRGEIPHKRGIMSGRYPVKGAKIVITLLKSLKANALVNELELEKYKVHCIPNVSSKPYRRFGQGKFKRCHITLKLIPIIKNKKEKK